MNLYRYLKFLLIVIFLFQTGNLFSQNGVVKGRVYDAINNEPLPFVNVVVSGTTTGTTTDFDGNFIITGLEPGFIRLEASFIGYQTQVSSEIQVSNANPAFIDIAMRQSDQEVEEVVVRASPFRRTEESPVSLRSIGISEIENSPGANRDISKVIQSFPGVSSSVSFRNDIIVRGGGPSESRFYLDGVEVPNINHFATQGASGGPVGIINADFIREVNYYSGAFPANRGNALSGVFEFKQVDGNSDKLKFRGSVGASEVSATFDGPVGDNTTFIFSARRSYLQFLFDVIGLPFLPTFNDFQFKSRTRFDKKNELTIVGLGAIDQFKLNLGIDNPTEEQRFILSSIPVNEQWSYAVGGVYKHFREKSYQTLVVSRNHLNNVAFKYFENDDSSEDNKILDYESQEIENKIRYESTSRFSGYKLIYGANLDFAKYTNNTFQKRFIGQDVFNVDYETELDMIKYGLFSQMSKDFFNSRLSLSVGLRMDGNNYSSDMNKLWEQFSPRFSASYFINDLFSLNFNTGRYYQLPPYTSLGYKKNGQFINKENNLKYISVDHIIGGVEYRPNSYTQIVAEGFYKKYDQYPYSLRDSMSLANKGADFGVIGDEEVISISEGQAYGFEILGRIKSPKGLNLNLSYTFVRSEFNDGESDYIPSAWDNKHLLTLTSTKDLKKNWKVGIRWRFVGGPPYTPYDIERSERVEAWNTQGRPFFDMSRLNSKRLDPFHQLDVRVDKAYFFDRWSLMLYLDIQNFYNFKGELQDNLVRETDEKGNFVTKDNGQRYELKRIPSTSGTVLPTIGIIIEI